ncbi:MAG: malonate transporter subunit MadM [Bacteroidota bacterium]|jgi:malonate transporter MadM subunit
MELLTKWLVRHDLIFAFLTVGIIMFLSSIISKKLTNNKIPAAAIAIITGLLLAYMGGNKGIASIPLFSGMALLGGNMMRDFTVVSTAMGASISQIKKAGLIGTISLVLGVIMAFLFGSIIAYILGYHDAKSIVTIGAGACTFIVGPVTGTAIGASSDIIAISIAIGVVKSVLVTLLTPAIAKQIGLKNPETAMIYGGMIGTTSGVTAGLAAVDTKLVPYGALTATFYTGLGCLLCPSLLYYLTSLVLS